MKQEILVAMSFSLVTYSRSLASRRSAFCGRLPCRPISRSTIQMMPEGPEVRTLTEDLQYGAGARLVDFSFVSGRYTNERPNDFAGFSKTMTQLSTPEDDEDSPQVDVITKVQCKGKFLYFILDTPEDCDRSEDSDFQRSIWVTLGMTGRFWSDKKYEQRKPDHVRWVMTLRNSDRTIRIYYTDPRNFGTLRFCLSKKELEDKLISLGPDMFYCDEEQFLQVLDSQKKTRNICRALMDQSKVSGIGNYILSECLYRANIDPFASLVDLATNHRRRLFQEIKKVMYESYAGQSSEEKEVAEYEYQCYGQQFCKQQGDPVIRQTNGPHGRTIWYTKRQLGQLSAPECSDEQTKSAKVVASQVTGRTTATAYSQLDPQPTKKWERISSEKRGSTGVPPPQPRASSPAEAQTRGNALLAQLLSDNHSSTKRQERFDESRDDDTDGHLVADEEARAMVTSFLDKSIVDEGWKSLLIPKLLKTENFYTLVAFLDSERQRGVTIFPPQREIFAALNLCPLDSVKVVIVGQDPYHRQGQGHGLAFSVRKGVRPPPSLQNIIREATEDVGIETPYHGNLEAWSRQGVLLLNTVLTVEEGKAFSHSKKGWEEVTDMIIKAVCQKNEPGIVFLLWGNAAAKKVETVLDDSSVYEIIRSSHPSPLGATKTNLPFLGSQCFSRANKALVSFGKDPVDWNFE